ncbi:hypothetical protein KRE40_01115 [Elizabethkingia meningoseptica]|uniref:Uncharacterized protein n=1 Tax=Elizabethkingia meningoseptica TaxID=238 RepID=A0A1V3TXZ3_ELIME|nr:MULTISPECIES: hypothetical protein [Elizabethkingia]AQX13113.1 hypothetical protein BBD35_12350 [Elizabethkingia meningoseptica]EJK5328821.1 hypothetical protein [Elizabethkingia meningoseptica]MDE5431173.1 hypothetical protein [Elizabethkingia meningoseptica]MDE5433565.1 hypothetical protein [Elizabethkingia meningoseptica]MDE5437716.1 hypothetical protein [Elizabethkingia meningoseptica]
MNRKHYGKYTRKSKRKYISPVLKVNELEMNCGIESWFEKRTIRMINYNPDENLNMPEAILKKKYSTKDIKRNSTMRNLINFKRNIYLILGITVP